MGDNLTKKVRGKREWTGEVDKILADRDVSAAYKLDLVIRGLKEAGFRVVGGISRNYMEINSPASPYWIRIVVDDALYRLDVVILKGWDNLGSVRLHQGEWEYIWERIRELWVSEVQRGISE